MPKNQSVVILGLWVVDVKLMWPLVAYSKLFLLLLFRITRVVSVGVWIARPRDMESNLTQPARLALKLAFPKAQGHLQPWNRLVESDNSCKYQLTIIGFVPRAMSVGDMNPTKEPGEVLEVDLILSDK